MMGKLTYAKGAVKGAWLMLTNEEYREYAAEVSDCPECAPLAPEMCDEHFEEGEEHWL